MVTTGQIVGMALAAIIPVGLIIMLEVAIHKNIKKKGLFSCFVYGMLGYCWQIMIYAFVNGWLGSVMAQCDWFKAGFGHIVYMMINAIVYALFVMMAAVWCIYLANMRVRDFDRGVPIGVGYGAAYVFWSYLLTYGAAFVYSIQMKAGSFSGSAELKEKLLALSVENMYLFIADMIIFLLIMTGTMVLVSHFFTKGQRIKMILVPIISQYVIHFLDAFLPYMLKDNDVLSSVILHIVTGTMAVYSLWLVYGYLKSGRLVILPTKSKDSSEE
ncbi:MAG: hypothetical protein K5639_06030 [Eubacterium sp.]|nr:hypothetical protein [Eubacterium sp.]